MLIGIGIVMIIITAAVVVVLRKRLGAEEDLPKDFSAGGMPPGMPDMGAQPTTAMPDMSAQPAQSSAPVAVEPVAAMPDMNAQPAATQPVEAGDLRTGGCACGRRGRANGGQPVDR